MWKCPKCGREFKNVNQSHYCGEKPKTIEEYILSQDEEKQSDLFLVRQILKEALPEAEEESFPPPHPARADTIRAPHRSRDSCLFSFI